MTLFGIRSFSCRSRVLFMFCCHSPDNSHTGNASGVAYLEFDIPGFDKNNFYVRNLRQYVKGCDVGAPLLHKLKQVSIKGVRHCIECGATRDGRDAVQAGVQARRGAARAARQEDARDVARAGRGARSAPQGRRAGAGAPGAGRAAGVLAPLQARAGVEYCFAFNKVGVCTREGRNYFPCCKADTDEVKEAYARAGL
jgi:hypothetical protein